MRDELDDLLDTIPSSFLGWRYLDRARAIRERERKLAGLASEYAEFVRKAMNAPEEFAMFNRGDWLRRYEEAIK